MNHTSAWARRATLLILTAILGAHGASLAQTSDITFQGQLADTATGVPVPDDDYDMIFYLRYAQSGTDPRDRSYVCDGTAHSKVPVTKGVFAVTMNFGLPSPFDGSRLWIEPGIHKPGLVAYELLERKEITSAPYAIMAANVASGGLAAGTYGNSFTFNNPANIFTGDGSGLKSLNAANISGPLADGLLSPNVALLNRNQAFTGNNSFGNIYVSGLLNLATDTSLFSGVGLEWVASHPPGDGANSYFLRARKVSHNPHPFPDIIDPVFLVRGDGFVGVGTDNPTRKLDVRGGGMAVQNGPGLAGTALSSTFVASAGSLPGLVGADSALANFGVTAEGNNVSLGLRARRSYGGTGWTTAAIGLTVDVDDTIQAGGGLWLASSGNVGSGNVGIGTSRPQAPLHVDVPVSTTPIDAMKLQVESFSTMENAIASGFLTVQDVGSGKTAFRIRGDGNVGIGTADPQFPLDVVGQMRTCILQIKGGCDIAEPFEMSGQEIPKGSLVVIDEENAGKLKLASQEYDTRIAGIVSGANGVNPGISLYQEGVMDSGQNVALSGRVYALADASYGDIRPGDLLTSSATPGHVRKVTDHARSQGAIVGKAMSTLKDGKGMVLVLVTLQ